MQKLLVLAVVAIASSYAFDPECMNAFMGQKDCFFGVVKTAFGANDDMDMEQMKMITKGCFEENDCKVPRSMSRPGSMGMSDAEPTRHRRDGKGKGGKGGKMGRDYKRMKECVTEKKDGGDPFELVKACVQEETGMPLPNFMNHAPRSDAHVFNNKRCPYFRMLKFIAMSGNMGAHVTKMCGGDEAKKEAVLTCVSEGTGVDMDALDRDDIKDSMCENKDSCYTEKLTECKQSIRDMIKSACRCKTELLNDAMYECAAELEITLPEELTMECEPLFAQKKKLYDMCHTEFEFPGDDVYMRGGKGGSRHRRHNHHSQIQSMINDDHPILYFI